MERRAKRKLRLFLLFHPRRSRLPCYLLKGSAESAVTLESAFVRQFCGRPKNGAAIGPHLMMMLKTAASKNNIEIRTSNKVTGLLTAVDGSVTGGLHGANRLGGNGVADIVVNGRLAALAACKYLK